MTDWYLGSLYHPPQFPGNGPTPLMEWIKIATITQCSKYNTKYTSECTCKRFLAWVSQIMDNIYGQMNLFQVWVSLY